MKGLLLAVAVAVVAVIGFAGHARADAEIWRQMRAADAAKAAGVPAPIPERQEINMASLSMGAWHRTVRGTVVCAMRDCTEIAQGEPVWIHGFDTANPLAIMFIDLPGGNISYIPVQIAKRVLDPVPALCHAYRVRMHIETDCDD